MSLPVIHIPRLSPVQFVDASQPDSNQHHIRHILTDWYKRGIRDSEDDADYYQKIQFDQPVTVQLHATTNTNRVLWVIKPQCNGQGVIVHTVPLSLSVTLPGNIEDRTGTSQQLITYHYVFRFQDIPDLSEGIYYLMWNVEFASESRTLISEPLYVRANHPGTLLFKYYNDSNDYHVIFEQTGAKFFLRAEADLGELTPVSQLTTYADQRRRRSKLHGTPDRFFELFIDRVPEYLLDKIDALTICDHWSVDGIALTRDEGEKWEYQRVEGNPLTSGTLTVYEADPDASTFIVVNAPLEIYPLPGAYPYAISLLKMGENSVPNVDLLSAPRIISGAGGEATLVADLNTLVGNFGYTGFFSIADNKLYYFNGPGEIYNAAAYSIATTNFYFEINTPSPNYYTFFSHQFAIGAVVDWGDGTVERLASFNVLMPAAHEYAVSDSYAVTVWGNLRRFEYEDGALQYIEGSLPAVMQTFRLRGEGASALSEFDFDRFALAAGNLLVAEVTGHPVLVDLHNQGAIPFTKLAYVNFSSNALNQTDVSTLLEAIRDRALAESIYNGTLYVHNQNPPVVLTLGGSMAKSVLITNFSWTVAN